MGRPARREVDRDEKGSGGKREGSQSIHEGPYDKKAQPCELKVGMLVLVRTPNLSGKLDRLRKAGLTAKPAKCQWRSASLTFLGHTVGRGKVSTPDHRVEAIRNHVMPVTKKGRTILPRYHRIL